MKPLHNTLDGRGVPLDLEPVDWAVSPLPVDYPLGVRTMADRAQRIARGVAPELVWLLEHPPIYTAGTGTKPDDLRNTQRFPVHQSGRGGRVTYHGPGQRIAYVMLDVKRRGADVRAFVHALEQWLIESLAALGVKGETRPGRVGVWVRRQDREAGGEDKIAAIGLRISKWVSLHGVSINVNPNLGHYDGIVPCGIADHGVTSLADLGSPAPMETVDNALRTAFEYRFGATHNADDPLSSRLLASPVLDEAHP
jgi:lipoyl(octanoyl) transferase